MSFLSFHSHVFSLFLLEAKPARVFRFEEIREAHRTTAASEAGGKMVVVHG
jgi:NADPH2:quinone reductase